MESTVLSLGKSVLSGALGYASSAVAQEVALQLGIQGDHSFITDELEMMQAFLMTAHEEPEDNKVVKTWVKQVRDVAYDVEDCLQDFAVRLENLSWWHIPFRLLDRRRVAKEMKELRAKVEDVSQRNLRYRLIDGSSSKPTATAERSTISTEVLLHIAEATRTALKQSKKVDLVKLITEDANDLGVIAVWGVSSDVGVTSIIRAAYDDKNVKAKFQCRAWVRLMHPFNPSDLFISLVRQFYVHSCEETGKATEGTTAGMEVMKKMAAQDNLVDEFNRYVTEKSYLVIINGVSTIEEWDWIKTYFPSKNGSRIVVSTKKFEVASLCTEQPYTVSEIDQKWSFDKDFYVFYYKKVDTSIKEAGKAKSSSIEPAGEEHVKKPTHATTVAAALEDDQLIDRKAAKDKVIRLIEQRGYVITICGMGGLGKTTLVRGVYQQELGEMFQRRAWLTMSRSFEHEEFLRKLFQQLRHEDTKKTDKLQSASSDKEYKSRENKKQTLFEKLVKILLEQKCLIVLDDLSSIVELHWVLDLLPVNTSNRIIVTTREQDIAKCCSSEEEQIYNLELLDYKEAILLFAKKVFKDIREKENFDHNPDMIEQANLVLKKCGGLPLAISTVGSFLATKPKTAMEWRNLNTHISAELESNPELGMIKTVLTSSYDGLPYHLKACFLYWSIFPEDHDIRWTRLVRRWIAERYARGTRKKTAEEIGNNYITELTNRNMVRPPKRTAHMHSSGRLGFLQIHDLIREIGISKSTEENLVFTLENGCNLDTQGKIRHLAISSSWTRDKSAFEHGLDFSHLRSLTVFGGWEPFFISDQMKLLRVLDLEDTEGLTDHHLYQICQLFHLNYLSLRRCDGILQLPNSLGNLKHLQTLDVEDTSIIKLPRSVIKLRKLQYLRVGFVPEHDDEKRGRWTYPIFTEGFRRVHRWLSYLSFHLYPRTGCLSLCYRSLYYLLAVLLWLLIITGYLLYLIGSFSRVLLKDGFDGLPASFMGLDPHGVKFPRGIRKLKALHTMGVVNINGGNAILEDLQFLTELRKLRVTGLNKKNCRKFFSAIANHKCLESLSMRSEGKPGFFGCLGDLSSLPINLQSLELYGNLVEMPKWIDGLKNLVKLVLRSSRISEHDATMQVLGKLPNLAILRLLWHSLEGEEVYFSFYLGAFPSLMVLELGVQDNLRSVKFEAGATPKLELLVFSCRPEDANIGLFSGLPSLTNLKEFMLDSDNYKVEFMENLRNQLAKNSNGPVLKRYNYNS